MKKSEMANSILTILHEELEVDLQLNSSNCLEIEISGQKDAVTKIMELIEDKDNEPA